LRPGINALANQVHSYSGEPHRLSVAPEDDAHHHFAGWDNRIWNLQDLTRSGREFEGRGRGSDIEIVNAVGADPESGSRRIAEAYDEAAAAGVRHRWALAAFHAHILHPFLTNIVAPVTVAVDERAESGAAAIRWSWRASPDSGCRHARSRRQSETPTLQSPRGAENRP
jgi:hypothetical protein